MTNIKVGYERYAYRFCQNADKIDTRTGQCAIDYIFSELAGKHSFMWLKNKQQLIDEFKDKLVSTTQIIEFAKKYNVVSVYALDPFLKVILLKMLDIV